MLDAQIQIFSIDTGNFYSNREERLHLLNHKLRAERQQLINGAVVKHNGVKRTIRGLNDITNDAKQFELNETDLELIFADNYNLDKFTIEEQNYIFELANEYVKIKNIIDIKRRKIKDVKNSLLKLLENKTQENIISNGKHHVRELRENKVSKKEEISVFNSSFTRMIGAEIDILSEDFMVVQVYYFDILHDLINYGFNYNGEKYIYFTSSAGQIRNKKCVFIKESIWNKYEKTIMCGLTVEAINKQGGNNPNKHLAYLALINSATDVWDEFDIDKTIVIDDFETCVWGQVDFIDDTDFSVTRKEDNIPIPHTDGCGMILPNAFGVSQKNKMIRLPWIKGLVGVFDYRKFIEVHNCSPVIRDIYGCEHNIIDEDIQVIFTKSQFKMWKYYESYEQYKEYYKQYNCSAGFTNPEEDRIKNATINYQMLQSLPDITDDEINAIVQKSVDVLQNISSSINGVKDAFGITPYNQSKTYLQKSIEIYPELLNDVFIKDKLRDIKDSMVKSFKSGKLKIHGKYTFILPDLYAACEYWFLNNSNPNGLLDNGEVFCWLFRKSEKLDCLRSPHLFCEHAIRNNVAYYKDKEKQESIRTWFTTDAIYTSCKDLISKILMFDVDGDKSLVVADSTIIKVAERNIKKYDIVPLYYNMRKALPSVLNNETIYKSLVLAFTSAPIGVFSNNISKIWCSDVFVNGSYEEQQHAINCIKRLCCQNNMIIDFAKTLYKPEFPEDIKVDIQEFTKQKLPFFFKFAKDKEEIQVRNPNLCFVNKIIDTIPNPRIKCKYINGDGKNKSLEKPDYKLLMTNPDIEVKVVKSNNGRLIEGSNPVVLKYNELAKKYGMRVNAIADSSDARNLPREILYKSKNRQVALYGKIFNEVKDELSVFGYSEREVADILVKYLYEIKASRNKDLLWTCYGEYLFDNLCQKVKGNLKTIQCEDCGEWFEISTKDNQTSKCKECYTEYRREYKAIKEKIRRLKLKQT